MPVPERPSTVPLPSRLHRVRRALSRGLRLAWLLAVTAAAPASHAADCPAPVASPDAATLQAPAAAPQDRGPLWRLTRDGHVSYLLGSMHLGRAAWIVPGPALQAAWAATDTLAIELDPTTVTAASLAGLGKTHPLSPTQSRRLDAQARAECVEPAQLKPLPPMLRLATVTSLASRRDGLVAELGTEMLLLVQARGEQRPVIGLETLKTQMDALTVDDPALQSRLVDSALTNLENGSSRAQALHMAELWARADLAQLGDPAHWCDCADRPEELAFLTRLNDARNPAMAERISAEHARGRRLLIAVGALHMTGAQALPRLLAERGFTVEPLVPAP